MKLNVIFDSINNKGNTTTSFHKQHLHGIIHGAEVINLATKHLISKLSEGSKHNSEHDHKTKHVLRASRERGRKLGHSLVEADVFKDLKD